MNEETDAIGWASLSLTSRIRTTSYKHETPRGILSMAKQAPAVEITREQLIEALNADLAREYQAIIAYVNYSQVLKGAEYMNIAKELEVHAGEELAHALQIAKQIDYLGGMPTVVPEKVKTSKNAKEMLRFDLDNELQTIAHYRNRIREAESLGEFALCEILRQITKQEQEHAIDLATALGIEVPEIPDVGSR
jgi:bacterioferritin